MNVSKSDFFRFSHPIKRLLIGVAALLLFAVFCLLSACSKQIEYFDYVSELRHDIFLAETDSLSLRIYGVKKESPYLSDGIPDEVSSRTEIYLAAPSGNQTYSVSFSIDGEPHGGEMSYDNVKGEYYYFCSLDISGQTEIACVLTCADEQQELTAKSVKDENTMTAQSALQTLITAEQELFDSLTDKYGFAGEIYVRLLYEENAYYYIGVIDRNGNTTAYLLNASSGKLLAKRES